MFENLLNVPYLVFEIIVGIFWSLAGLYTAQNM